MWTSTGAVVTGVLGLGGSALGLSGSAFVGAIAAFGLVILLARLSGGGTDRVILAGVAGTQLFSALALFVVFAFADSNETRGVMFGLLGSLARVSTDERGRLTVLFEPGDVDAPSGPAPAGGRDCPPRPRAPQPVSPRQG